MSIAEKEHELQGRDRVISKKIEENASKNQALEIAEDARQKEWKDPSFSQKLFMGEFHEHMVFPFPKQSDEDKALADPFIEQLMHLLKTQLDPETVDETREIPRHVIDEMGRMGIFALKIPQEYGGLGWSQTNYNRLVMRVASYCSSTAVLISAHQSIGVPQPLCLYGTEEQKRKFLPLFREGKISAFALTEKDVGSDPARMVAEAQLTEDQEHYILNGTKLWCTNGSIADYIIVMAKTAPKIVHGKPKTQISAFILDMTTQGIEMVHRCEFMGLQGIYNAYLKFTDVKIPKENLLGEEGRGLALALGTINVGRLTLPAACTGGAKLCLSIARRFGKERVQWGKPIGLHEEGEEKIAYIAATTFAMEAVTWLTSAFADKKDVDIRIEAAQAKLFTTEELWKIADLTLQLRGGRGYEKGRSLKARGEIPYPVERILRDCRINRILEGTTEIMKLFLAREAVDQHFKMLAPLLSSKASVFLKIKTFFSAICFYTGWYGKQIFAKKKRYPEADILESELQFIEETSHKMAKVLFDSLVKYRKKLEDKQLLLGRLMDMGTDLFAMSAACSYAFHIKNEEGAHTGSLNLAKYFCTLAKRRIEERFLAIKDNDDEESASIAKATLDRQYRWLEKGIEWVGPDV